MSQDQIKSPENFDVNQGRIRLATTIISGHTFKHLYLSGLRSAILPVMATSLGLSNTTIGALNTVNQATNGVTTVGAGYLGDRYTNRSGLILFLSIAIMGIALFIVGSTPNKPENMNTLRYFILFFGMFLSGLGPSLFHPLALGALTLKFPKQRGFLVSLHGSGGSAGEVLGPIIAGGLLTGAILITLTWNEILQWSILPAVIVGLVIWLVVRNLTNTKGNVDSFSEYITNLKLILKNKPLMVLGLATVLRAMGQTSLIAFLPIYLLRDLEFSFSVQTSFFMWSPASQLAVPLMMASSQAMGIASQPIMGFMSDKLNHKFVLVPGMMILGVASLGIAFVESNTWLIILILIIGIFAYSLHAIFIAYAINNTETKMRSTIIALVYGVSFMGAFAPILAGLIGDFWGTQNTFIFAGLVTILGGIVTFFYKPT
ncbi:MAG: MFS transporter [SAR202 cluster bacterium]|nr:MFS transporter [SAR202 cluster bacterium]